MRRFKAVLSLFIIMAVLNGCDNGMSGNDDMNESGRIKSVSASNTGGFDLKPYFDASNNKNNAYEVTIKDFEKIIVNKYKCMDSEITFNKKEHTVNIKSIKCNIRNNDYINLNAKYEYKLMAAGENLLYICPVNKNIEVYANNQVFNANDISPFCLYISFYGFGEGRIEVSSFLNEESIISGGTYWAVK